MRTSVEQPNRVGLVLFWIAVAFVVISQGIGWAIATPAYRNLTMEELNQTFWASGGFGAMWQSFSVPLGGILAGIAVLLYSGAKGSTVWKFGIGIVLALFIGMVAGPIGVLGHFPLWFGVGGWIIMLSFTGILWFWAKERRALKGLSTAAADLKLVGYVFMLIAAWFICGIASEPFWKVYEGQAPTSPLHVMILLALGWLFLFLSYYKSREQKASAGP